MAAVLAAGTITAAAPGDLTDGDAHARSMIVADAVQSEGDQPATLGRFASRGQGSASPAKGDRELEIALAPHEGSITSSEGATSLEMRLPVEVNVKPGEVSDDGSVVFEGKGMSSDVVVQSVESGFRVATIIHDATAPSTFTYALDTTADLRIEADGSVALTEASTSPDTGGIAPSVESVVGIIASPWARDATGRSVPTHYILEGRDLVQVVEHDESYTYPIVADPTYTKSWLNHYAWFNRAETATISQSGWGVAALIVVCTAAAGPVLGATCALAAGSIVYQAGIAQNSNPKKCLVIRMTDALVAKIAVPYTYKGARCK